MILICSWYYDIIQPFFSSDGYFLVHLVIDDVFEVLFKCVETLADIQEFQNLYFAYIQATKNLF